MPKFGHPFFLLRKVVYSLKTNQNLVELPLMLESKSLNIVVEKNCPEGQLLKYFILRSYLLFDGKFNP